MDAQFEPFDVRVEESFINAIPKTYIFMLASKFSKRRAD